MNEQKKVVILGGGPTALASAVRLADQNVPTCIIERLPWLGGLCQSYRHGDFVIDLGPHRFTPHSKEVLEFIEKRYRGRMLTVDYKAQIWVNGRLVRYPFKIKDVLTKLPPSLSLNLLSTSIKSSFTAERPTSTYEEWVLSHFGSSVTELVFRPLVEKVWGTPLSQLAARFARQRIASASLWEIAWEAMTGRRSAQFHSSFYPDNGFLYPEDGFGALMDGLTESFKNAGGQVETEATVTGVHFNGNRVESVSYEKKGQTVVVPCSHVISTIPIQYFFKICSPSLPQQVTDASQRLKTRRLVLLFVVIKKDRFSENTSMYFPSSEFLCGRIWEQKNHSAATIPTPGRTVLGLEIPCWDQDSVWTSTDDQLSVRALKPFYDHGFLKKEDVQECFSVRLGHVYPVWDVDFEKNLNPLIQFERSIENLIFNGRPGLFFYNNLHHSLEMGFLAAKHIISGKPKDQCWIPDSKLFEEYRLVE